MTARPLPQSVSAAHMRIEVVRGDEAPIRIALDLPDIAAVLLPGRPASAAVRLVPSCYAVCAMAHATAAAAAVAMAQGYDTPSEVAGARSALTEMEALREAVLRVCLGWPALIGETADVDGARPVVGVVRRLRAALFGSRDPFDTGEGLESDAAAVENAIGAAEEILVSSVFGEPLAAWRSRRTAANLVQWSDRGATVAARFIREIRLRGWDDVGAAAPVVLDAEGVHRLAKALAEDGSAREILARMPLPLPETSVFAHRSLKAHLDALCAPPGGLLARNLAVLTWLADLPERMRLGLEHPVAPALKGGLTGSTRGGLGVGTAMTARGVLIHALTARDGRVVRYGVIQPTLLNFAAGGVAERALEALARTERGCDETLLAKARMLVNAIDPCVQSDVRVR